MNMLDCSIIPDLRNAFAVTVVFEGIDVEHLARLRMNTPLSIRLFTMELHPPDFQVSEALVTYSKMRTWKEGRT